MSYYYYYKYYISWPQLHVLCLPFLPSSYQICEFLYEKKHMYDRIIDCYLRDPLRKVTYISDLSNYTYIWLECVQFECVLFS